MTAVPSPRSLKAEVFGLVDLTDDDEKKVAPLLRLVRDQIDEQPVDRDLPFIGMLEAEPDFAERSEEILHSEDNHSL